MILQEMKISDTRIFLDRSLISLFKNQKNNEFCICFDKTDGIRIQSKLTVLFESMKLSYCY